MRVQLMMLFLASCLVLPQMSLAADDEAKAIMQGIFGIVVEQAITEMEKPKNQPNTEIQWNEPVAQTAPVNQILDKSENPTSEDSVQPEKDNTNEPMVEKSSPMVQAKAIAPLCTDQGQLQVGASLISKLDDAKVDIRRLRILSKYEREQTLAWVREDAEKSDITTFYHLSCAPKCILYDKNCIPIANYYLKNIKEQYEILKAEYKKINPTANPDSYSSKDAALLSDTYEAYQVITIFREATTDNGYDYISYGEAAEAKRNMAYIEKAIKASSPTLDTDALWKKVTGKTSELRDIMKQVSGLAYSEKLYSDGREDLQRLRNVANELRVGIEGKKPLEKDF